MAFKLISDYQPTGDQPEAINLLVEGIRSDTRAQTLLGVTGSGKTFTIANVIAELNRPTLVLSHNKTLAAQLYGEFKHFFPENAVEYFVSYYDYYQPEAYLPSSDIYIEKDLSINDEIEKLRLSATSALLSGRRDVIVVASVSCIYGIGNPDEFHRNVINLNKGDIIERDALLTKLVNALYSRSDQDFLRGTFRVRGDTIDIHLAYANHAIRLLFFGDELEEIYSINPQNGRKTEELEEAVIYPASIFITGKETLQQAMSDIKNDLLLQTAYLERENKFDESKRLDERVNYDLEMMNELGYCSGIENYSRYFDRRKPGDRPFCLLDYFPDDFLTIIDESHVTIPQIRAMYGGDRSRKTILVDYGFRLPSALDNRPLSFNEFENLIGQTIFMSATPADYELYASEGVIVEQIIRPTGLPDPCIEVRSCLNQVDDLLEEIAIRIEKKERVLVTTLTKRMAEDLSKYLLNLKINARYIHSDVDTIERVEIMRDLRIGKFDVLVGINLLREGLDLPEVSLVAILDADKEGFLRSERSLTQTAGRAARHINGKVIMYADRITKSMDKTISETNRRREKQLAFNEKHNIIPQQILHSRNIIFDQTAIAGKNNEYIYSENDADHLAADPVVKYMSKPELEKAMDSTRKKMEEAAKIMDFIEAARLRDELFKLRELFKKK